MTTPTTEAVLEITDEALEQIVALRDQEPIPDLVLALRITGIGPAGFTYQTAFLRTTDVSDADHVETHGDLRVAIPPDSIDNLRGSVLDLSTDPTQPGLVLRNPNPATPGIIDDEPLELTGTVEERITALLDQRINPAIASHGGWAGLAFVDGETAYLELGGGCQGCGLAAMTLRQGIETAIKQHIPEVTEIVDVTDHAAGVNPFYS